MIAHERRVSISLAALLCLPALAACNADDPDPAGPDTSGPYEVTLETRPLSSGSTGILVSDGFVGLELDPAVLVGGEEVDVRRLDDDRMEFDVPVLPAGTSGVDVVSPYVQASISARILGVVASGHVFPCFVPPVDFAFVAVGEALYFEGYCGVFNRETSQQGIARVWPEQPTREFEWIPPGLAEEKSFVWLTTGPSTRANHFVGRVPGPDSLPPDYRLWEAGLEPHPVEELDCYPEAPPPFFDFAAPVALGDGTCLLYVPHYDVVYRNAAPVLEEAGRGMPKAQFSVSDDGWAALAGPSRLLVFDAGGNLVFDDPPGGIVRAVRFGDSGGPLYVVRFKERFPPSNAWLQVVDRTSGEVLREKPIADDPWALSLVGDRLWLAELTDSFGGDLLLRRFDPETLELRQTVAVAPDLYLAAGGPPNLWPWHGSMPLLGEDRFGRLTFTGVPQDWEGAWSHVIEVE
ncbi:MAG: hypothetical protein PVF05_09400 [Gemmatimonadales bacterium]|jgi:hypothetical protein